MPCQRHFRAEGTLRLYQALQSPLNPSCVECGCFEVRARVRVLVCVCMCVCVCVCVLKRVEVDLKARHAPLTRT